MRKITIVGAGQAGLQLGIGLLGKGHQVTIVSNRSAAEIAGGKVLSSQSMYDMALGCERELGLSFWDESCPPIQGIHVRAGNDQAGMLIDFRARMAASGQSVDQRIKMPKWMDEFERLGGRLVIADAGIAEVEGHAAASDLVIVATGKGELGKLFERDAARCQFDRPQRTIALTYVHGMKPREDFTALNISINPGIGEFVHFPALTHSGPCDIINLEAVCDGPMDRWGEVRTPAGHLEMTKTLVREFFPWEAERVADIRLTDDDGILVGRVAPTVRKAVGTLPSGRKVLGMGDVLVLNDPMTGQGSNNASKGANLYLEAIDAHGDAPFDAQWMDGLAERYWDYAQWSARFTNSMLVPPPPHVLKLLDACGRSEGLARRFADAFNDPKSLAGWYYDPADAERAIGACLAPA
ncbi:styrene monooxygenase/indole monooxygenase family protein [Thauera sinica]|uniref:Styrene monooxygenase/indole monooxygenase family protein n=1 Tax=Thauera sinica TaxID=2665146 RepID=A0ABW1ATX3_9RHOO|nr:styrene monooxygenase/indole monooxygenase family protein [Thauera sp. K11]ATE62052.1 alanine-phosphoribitol ligase [Thauera sp. K11]